MVRYVIPTLLISTYLSAALVAQDKEGTVPPVPNTISREAQEFLRNSPPPRVVVPQSSQQWEAIRAQMREDWETRSMKVMEALEELLKSLRWAALRCISLHRGIPILPTRTRLSFTSTAEATAMVRRKPPIAFLPPSPTARD